MLDLFKALPLHVAMAISVAMAYNIAVLFGLVYLLYLTHRTRPVDPKFGIKISSPGHGFSSGDVVFIINGMYYIEKVTASEFFAAPVKPSWRFLVFAFMLACRRETIKFKNVSL